MKSLTLPQMVFYSALSLLMLLSLLVAAYRGPTSAQLVDFDAYRGATIPDTLIDGYIGNEWYDAEHRTDVLIDPSTMPPPYGIADIWTKNDGTSLYIALEFIADSENPWVAIMPSPWPSSPTICIGYDLAVFGDDNLDANGYVDAWFASVTSIREDTYAGGRQNGVGAIKIKEGNLTTIELKKPLSTVSLYPPDGDWRGWDIEWAVGGTYQLVIAWDSDGRGYGVGPGGSNGGNARHEGSVTARNIYIDPERKVPLTLFASVTANSSSVYSGETLDIAVQVTDGVSPVSGANVTLSSDLGGRFSPSSGTSDSNGLFDTFFTAPDVNGSMGAKISAAASKDGHVNGSGYADVLVLPLGVRPLSVRVTSNPNTVRSGESSTITVNVTDKLSFDPTPEATVTLFSNSEGNFSPESGNTDSNGIFMSTFTPLSVTQLTIITITANATKENCFGLPNQTQVTVQPPVVEEGTELPWIFIAGAAISIVVIAVVLIARRGRKDSIYEKMRKQYEEVARS